MGRPRRRWFSQLLEAEQRGKLARTSKGKDWRLFFHRPEKNGNGARRRRRSFAGFNLIF
jgi:hypothetical protein